MKSVALAVTSVLTGCVSLPPPDPVEMLDERSGISLRVVAEPLVLARERRDVAANARDYLTLAAVERNAAGHRDLVLLAYRWSTIDRRVDPQDDVGANALVLLIDGRDLRLEPLCGEVAGDLRPRPELHQPAVVTVRTAAYCVTRSTLESIATGDELVAFYADARTAPSFRLWRDGREALRRFSASLDGVGD